MKQKIKKTEKIKKEKKTADVMSKSGRVWIYSKEVKNHFYSPRNFMKKEDEKKFKWNATGIVGSPACGDMMRFWLLVDEKTEKIKDVRWRTFGCASAIASTSMLSVMLKEKGGMNLEKARKITPQDILKRLGGLPDRKIHCSVLGDKALRSAINNYYQRTKQYEKMEDEKAKIIDRVLKITDKDIERAVLEGADTLEKVKLKTKVGIGDPACLPEAEELVKFYKEKYCELPK